MGERAIEGAVANKVTLFVSNDFCFPLFFLQRYASRKQHAFSPQAHALERARRRGPEARACAEAERVPFREGKRRRESIGSRRRAFVRPRRPIADAFLAAFARVALTGSRPLSLRGARSRSGPRTPTTIQKQYELSQGPEAATGYSISIFFFFRRLHPRWLSFRPLDRGKPEDPVQKDVLHRRRLVLLARRRHDLPQVRRALRHARPLRSERGPRENRVQGEGGRLLPERAVGGGEADGAGYYGSDRGAGG